MTNKTDNNNSDNITISSDELFSKLTPTKLTHTYDKYKIFLITSFILHILYFLIFFYYKIYYFSIYNIFSAAVYIFSYKSFKFKNMEKIFIIINIELILFIITSSLLGLNKYFIIFYFLALPLTLFSSISRKKELYNLKLALIQYIILTIIFVGTYLYSNYFSPFFIPPKSVSTICYIVSLINIMFVSIMAFLLNYALLSDVNAANQRLASINNKLNHIATHDPLTNLINRRSMNEQLYVAIENYNTTHNPFCLILSDIDDFKKVNDVYGHDTGDIILKRVSKIISNIVPNPGVVCRWGGEEILILVYGDLTNGVQIAEQIRKTIESTSFTFNNNYVKTTLTLGVAQYNPTISVEKNISIADNNLYKGKKSTKNCVVS